jgi:hypothetical protein
MQAICLGSQGHVQTIVYHQKGFPPGNGSQLQGQLQEIASGEVFLPKLYHINSAGHGRGDFLLQRVGDA